MLSGQFVWQDPRTWTAWQAIIAVNVAVFIAELATGVTLGGNDSGWVFWHGVLLGPPLTAHNPWAGISGIPSAVEGSHQYWRLLTAGFLQAGIVHIGMNMFSLFFVGRAFEPAVGRGKFCAIYFAALLAGSFGALAFTPDTPELGASGAIFGIFGALIAIAHARRISLWQSGLMPILLINVVFTLTVADVSLGGHLGGLLAGLVLGRAFVHFSERKNRPSYFYAACAAVAVLSIAGALLVAGATGIAPNGITL